MAPAALPFRAGHRRALLHPQEGLRHDPVRPAPPQGLRRGAGALGNRSGLAAYFERLEGKDQVKLVCMDLSSAYRSLVRNHFPNALIVADRFHVIRLINHHFLACWRELDPAGSRNRGLLSLMRRHRHNLKPEQLARLTDYLAGQPALQRIYRFKQRLCCLLLQKHKTRRQCRPLAARFLKALHQLRESGLAQLMQLGDTLYSWRNEIALMWRFTRNNGMTEGFHNKIELISRQAFGFRNFDNSRMRVKVLCA
ncbi:MAG: transposase [Bryobacteraceae bacterium]|nr:transposase [Bryobacteraceae bacterium]